MSRDTIACQAAEPQSRLVAVATELDPEQLGWWFASTQLAASLRDLDPEPYRRVIDRIYAQTASPEPPPEARADAGARDSALERLTAYLKQTFTFPPLDRERLHCEPCMREDNEKMLHVAIGIISPLSRLRWLGSGFISEGRFLGEGKDAIVHAVRWNPDWVIKTLKFGGADRAEMLAFYTNRLAAEASLKVPALTHLGDGRLLQEFVRGEPIANAQYLVEGLAAQTEALRLASIAREVLGIRAGETFIEHPPYQIGVDPSFANFLFDAEGKLSGWIDPLYSLATRAAEHGR